jgi:glycosyltransferase involved in cell wall biosynthesis
MKVLHIVGGDISGGAARGAHWLHNALIKKGVQSMMLVSGTVNENDTSIISLSNSAVSTFATRLRGMIDRQIVSLCSSKSQKVFSTGFVGFNFTKTKEYRQADIIHMHWINGGMVNIKHLANIDKPVVWTIRDMWPFTGGCHYSLDCNNYKYGCGVCPQLGSINKKDLSHIIFDRKQKHLPENLTIIGISNWLTSEAKNSRLFENHKCHTILNNIDTSAFLQIDKNVARRAIGVFTKKKIVACGAASLDDYYKGFPKFIESLKHLNSDEVYLITFGELGSHSSIDKEFECRHFGFVKNDSLLNKIYSAADVFVAPSIQEAFGKTLAESQCAGTPVVCFDATGPKDLVDHKITGYRAKPFDSGDLAVGINWVMSHKDPIKLNNAAREKVVKDFDSRVVGQQYIELYESIVGGLDYLN